MGRFYQSGLRTIGAALYPFITATFAISSSVFQTDSIVQRASFLCFVECQFACSIILLVEQQLSLLLIRKRAICLSIQFLGCACLVRFRVGEKSIRSGACKFILVAVSVNDAVSDFTDRFCHYCQFEVGLVLVVYSLYASVNSSFCRFFLQHIYE